jgi:hypothetical protein
MTDTNQPQVAQSVTSNTDTAWIEPYYKMDKDELLNNTNPETVNQIRNTLGDQKFIDQWKLSEADYNRVIESSQPTTEQQAAPVEQTQVVENTVPTSTVYHSQVHPAGTVRRVYGGNYHHGSIIGGRRYIGGYYGHQGHSYYPGSYYGHHGHSYYPGSYYGHHGYYGNRSYIRGGNTVSTTPVTRVIAPQRTSVTRTAAPLRTSIVRTQAPVTRIAAEPLRSSIVRTQVPVTTTAEPVRTSVVVNQAPVTRVIAGNTLRSSYVGAPLRSSYVGAPLRSSYVGAPLRSSYVGNVGTLRNSTYVVGGSYPATRSSVLRTSAVHRPTTTYYPATSSRVVTTTGTRAN